MQDILLYFCSLSTGQGALISEVEALAQLVLVMPATNATSECTFSALRRVKTYLRTAMTQQQLNHLVLLHIHRDRSINMIEVANAFAEGSEYRKTLFGTFSTMDLARGNIYRRSKSTQTILD